MFHVQEFLRTALAAPSAGTFFYLLLNNLGVLLLLWLVAAVWIYYAARVSAPLRKIRRLALCCYILFFLKEFYRINSSIVAFSRGNRIPYRDILVNLILPHGLIEYLAFVLAAVFALLWLGASLEGGRWCYPGHRALLVPALLLLLAAAIETTLTPYLYEIYLLKI